MTYEFDKTCCFTGHRIIPNNEKQFIYEKTLEICQSLIKRGFENFITGGALGFDTLAADCILSLKEMHKNIRLIMALPCVDQCKGWKSADTQKYEKILSLADEINYVSKDYSPDCMKKRNRFMVDKSCVCVSYIKRMSGGTAYTVSYAVESDREIIFIR